MSTKRYSRSSWNGDRLAAAFGAMSVEVPHDGVAVRLRGAEIAAERIDEALRSPGEAKLPVEFRFRRADSTVTTIRFEDVWTLLQVHVDGPDNAGQERLHGLVRDVMGLVDPVDDDWRGVASLPNINSILWSTYDKVVELEKLVRGLVATRSSRLRCFVSFRFDDHSKALALELRELLELADVEFVSGMGFEPRSVSDKVVERLTEDLQLFAIIHTSSGDSAWLNQEVGVARARSLPMIVLREGDAKFDSGILGDIEFIQFPANNISKSFVAVLQALNYVRRRNDRA